MTKQHLLLTGNCVCNFQKQSSHSWSKRTYSFCILLKPLTKSMVALHNYRNKIAVTSWEWEHTSASILLPNEQYCQLQHNAKLTFFFNEQPNHTINFNGMIFILLYWTITKNLSFFGMCYFVNCPLVSQLQGPLKVHFSLQNPLSLLIWNIVN